MALSMALNCSREIKKMNKDEIIEAILDGIENRHGDIDSFYEDARMLMEQGLQTWPIDDLKNKAIDEFNIEVNEDQ